MAVQVTIYLNEADQWRHRPLHMEILSYLRQENVYAATAFHAVAGFLGRHRVKTAHMVEAGGKLPVVITFVDTDEHVSRVLAIFWIVAGSVTISAQESNPDGPEANPGRPTVSTPATLTPVGYLQFETGFLGANHSPEFSSRYGFNEVMKLSVAPRLELLASGEPIAHYTGDGKTANSVADVFLG